MSSILKAILDPGDEVVVFANKEAGITHVDQITKEYSISCMRDHYVERIALIMMEPSNLGKKDVH